MLSLIRPCIAAGKPVHGILLGVAPSQDASDHEEYDIFRFGDPNLNLHLQLESWQKGHSRGRKVYPSIPNNRFSSEGSQYAAARSVTDGRRAFTILSLTHICAQIVDSRAGQDYDRMNLGPDVYHARM